MRGGLHIVRAARIGRDEEGGALLELAIVLPLFLLLFFGLIDFGRMGYEYVMAEKATDLAARIAVARPPACATVPEFNDPGPVGAGSVAPHYGTSCAAGANVCREPAPISCTGDLANATVAEIWTRVETLLPGNAEADNLTFIYSYDRNLGFLGGPFVPVVTVEVTDLDFRFSSPIGAMSTLAGGTYAGFSMTLPFPAMSVSLPAEDLAQGTDG